MIDFPSFLSEKGIASERRKCRKDQRRMKVRSRRIISDRKDRNSRDPFRSVLEDLDIEEEGDLEKSGMPNANGRVSKSLFGVTEQFRDLLGGNTVETLNISQVSKQTQICTFLNDQSFRNIESIRTYLDEIPLTEATD